MLLQCYSHGCQGVTTLISSGHPFPNCACSECACVAFDHVGASDVRECVGKLKFRVPGDTLAVKTPSFPAPSAN